MDILHYIGAAFVFILVVVLALIGVGAISFSVETVDNDDIKKPSIYIYGPAGCGKSTNAELLRKYFGLDSIIDDYAMMGDRQKVPSRGVLVIGQDIAFRPIGVRAWSYYHAMEMVDEK